MSGECTVYNSELQNFQDSILLSSAGLSFFTLWKYQESKGGVSDAEFQ